MDLRTLIEKSLEARVSDLEQRVNTIRPQAGGTSEEPAQVGVQAAPTINDGVTASINKIKYTYDKATNSWKDDQGQVAAGLQAVELFKAQGLNPDGKTPIKKGTVQKAKDYMSGKTAGLAQATRSDPKASLGKKLAGMAGAAIGGALAGKPGQPQGQEAPQAGDQAAPAAGGKKPIPGPTKSEYTALQKRTMQGDAGAAKELVDRLSNAAAKNYDINDFANSIGGTLKRSNIDKNLKTVLTQKARALRTEAYRHLNNILEAAGMTWNDLGYTVVISESTHDHVLLITNSSLNEAVQLAAIQNNAGL